MTMKKTKKVPHIVTFDEVLQIMKRRKKVQLKFHFVDGVYYRHTLQLRKSMVIDYSFVDNSMNKFTVEEYKKSIYGKAFKKHAVELIKKAASKSIDDLTDEQIARQDYIENEVYELIQRLNPTTKPVKRDMQMISDILDTVEHWFVNRLYLCSARNFYPYIDE